MLAGEHKYPERRDAKSPKANCVHGNRLVGVSDGHGKNIESKGVPELEILINGVFDKTRLLSMLRGFMVFENTGSDLIKKIAGYHQFHAVHKAVQCTISAQMRWLRSQ